MGQRSARHRSSSFALLVLSLAAAGLFGCSASSSPTALARSTAGTDVAADPATGPVPPFTSPGGPYLEDRYGRVVLMHGVDLVYKVAPFEVLVKGSGPNVLSAGEVQRMASLGFDVVRLGVVWKGLEPGEGGIDDPAVCKEGRPASSDDAQFDAAVFDAYVTRLDATISMLAAHGIYSLIDMHQDVYNEAFAGEGAPDWAVCTDGVRPRPKRNVANWSVNLNGPGVARAYAHFWHNDVVGNLQGEFDSLWARLAAHYRGDPWVVGYDPFNEPWAQGLPPAENNPVFDAELQCFYAGREDPGVDQEGRPITCPPDDPRFGVVARIEAADPSHLVFFEPNYATDSGVPNHIGPMPYPRLVLNFHDYCFLHVPNGPEPPDFASICTSAENYTFEAMAKDRSNDSTEQQPGGPASFLSEFGATTDASDLARVTADADAHLVGWMYWQWIHYDDPTGSHTSGLWPPGPATAAQLQVLSRAYAQAVAGTPQSMSFDPVSATFSLKYSPDPSISEPTVIFVPTSVHYPDGYCAAATGATVTSAKGSSHLDVVNQPGATSVTVTLAPGSC